MAASDTSIRSACHCGAIVVTVPGLPEYINVCQCTICRRYGAAWGYYRLDEVKVETTRPDAVIKHYVWGDRESSFDFCDSCGCMCYWWPLHPSTRDGERYEMGLNTNIVRPELLRFVERRITYTDLLRPLDSSAPPHFDYEAKS